MRSEEDLCGLLIWSTKSLQGNACDDYPGFTQRAGSHLLVYNYHNRHSAVPNPCETGVKKSDMFREQDINPAAFAYYRRLGRVQRYVDEHYADRITLQEAADVACLEKKYFSTYFHSKTGVRFIDWICWVRISHAKESIRCEDQPLSLVAEATGFSDLRSFERAFKKCTGMTPTEYKNSVRPS